MIAVLIVSIICVSIACICYAFAIYDNYKIIQQVKELQEWKDANKPTGICETCTAKSVEDMYRYKQILDEIEEFANKTCDACKEFTPNKQSGVSCRYCQPTQIRNIINKAKETK